MMFQNLSLNLLRKFGQIKKQILKSQSLMYRKFWNRNIMEMDVIFECTFANIDKNIRSKKVYETWQSRLLKLKNRIPIKQSPTICHSLTEHWFNGTQSKLPLTDLIKADDRFALNKLLGIFTRGLTSNTGIQITSRPI